MKIKFATLLIGFMALFVTGMSVQAQTATVVTDKDDYAPGEYVIISGTGWAPGETVNFTFDETPKPATCVNSHDIFAIADASGNIYNNQFLIKVNHIGVAFVLTATGQSSGLIATTEFKDANVRFTASGLTGSPTITANYDIKNTTTNALISSGSKVFTYPGPSSTPNIAVQTNQTITGTFPDVVISGIIYSAPDVSFSSNNNGNGVTTLVAAYTIAPKVDPVLTWNNPSNIVYGTPLTNIQLNATASVPGSFTYSPATNAILNAGNNQVLSVTFTPTNTTNYNTVTKTVSINIDKAPLTVTAQDASKTYGDANPALGVTYSGFVNGDDAADLTTAPTATTAATAASAVGSYAIVPAGGVSSNYNFGYNNGALTIGKALLTVTAQDASKTYGDANPALGVTYSGFVNGDDAADLTTAPTATTAATAASAVGSYAIVPAGGVSSNYNFAYNNGSLTIDKALLTVTAQDASKTYGDANPALSVTYSGFVNGDDAADLATAPTATTTATAASTVGSYAIVPAGGVSSNYNFAYNNGSLTIDKALLTVTAEDASKTYGDANPALSVTYSGFVNGDDAADLTTAPTATTTATAASTVGSYAIVPAGGVSSNYNFTYNNGSLNIGQRAITITADAQSKTYGDNDPALTAEVTSGTIIGSDAATGNLSRAAGENVGSYAISKASYTYGSNYNETYVGANLVIGQRAITITADAQSKTYGDNDPALTAQVTSGTIVGSDAATGNLSRAAGENVGSYAISKATYTYGSNYNETYVGENLVIGQRAITITADAQSKTYGDNDPALTAEVTSGTIVGSDAATGNLSRAAGENVGSYAISKASYTYGSNYNETYVGNNLVIGQRAITITADAQSKTYGNTDPALTAEVTSGTIVGSDAATGNLSRAAGENVGSYAISKATYTYGSNYNETYVGANLVIGQRAITITADAQSKTYGDNDPALTAQVTSGTIVGSDAATGNLSRAAGENVGSYAISKATYTYGSNYNETYVGANLVIGQRAITITADAQSKTYGDNDPALTAEVTSGTIVGSDVATGALARAAGENVGSYAISKASYTYGSNYNETYVGNNLVIGQRAITITADAQSKTYGDNDPALTAEVTSGTIVGSDAATGALARAAGENVGSYAISKATYTYGSNYNETYVGNNLVIGQRAITITADAQNKTYGDNDPALTAEVTSGTIIGSDAATGNLSRASGENVGSYAISKATYTYGSNYNETYVGANLVIGQRAITITADAQSKTYGDNDPALTAEVTSGTIVGSDAATGNLARAAGENVGSYAISKATYTYGSNYNETYVGANLVIGQRAITITADAQSKTYGNADPALTAQVTTGNIVNGDLASGALSRAAGENVGSYAISKASYTYGSNYNETYVGANLVIGQRAITITADAQSKTYGDNDPALTAQVTSGTIIGSDAATGALARAAGENVGSYAISKASYTYGSNYNETYVGANLAIGQRAITITADAQSKTYGDNDPALTAQVTSGTIIGSDAATGALARAAGENVGSYAISKASYTYGSNYNETYVGANLVIGQRAITITADAQSKTYGDNDPALTAQVTNGTIVGSDAATGNLSRAAGENVGSYAISKASYTYGSNYNETYVGNNLVIGQRAITITADAQSKTYGDNDPALTAQVTSGTIIGSDAATGALARAAGENVGSYAISKASYTYGSNYNETYVGANLVIGQRAITITADAHSKTYGDNDPALTAQVTSGTIVGSDAATGALARAAGENVGSYAISKATYTYGSNYNETYVGANLVIGQRAITITADAQSKTYGDNDPALTAEVTSGTIIGSDAATGNLSRAAGENVGSYAISKASYTYGSNYNETYVGANLVIGQRAITITADAQSKTYGDNDPALTAEVTSGTIIGSDAATGNLSRAAGENVGSYAISKASYTYGSNYNETYVGANLVIGQRAITITADAQSKTYGDNDPALTAQVTSGTIVGSDAATGNLSRAGGENVGSYAISKASYTYGSNYNETYVGANLVIGQRAITITADAKSKTYGDADPALTAEVTSGTIIGSDAATGALARAAGENVGSYAISKATYTYGSNYNETYVGENLVIGQRAITITADAQSKTYGDNDPALTAEVTSGTIVGSDAATGNLSRAAGENVGSYAISKASYTYGSNYNETYVGNNLVIGQRAITITADAQSKTYGNTDPALTAEVTSGTIVGSDAATGNLSRAAGENVGSYAISKATYTYGSNYNETYVGANLVIGQRAITITADAQSKTYGDNDPALTAQVTSGTIVGSDAATGNLSRAAGENVGSYAISKATYTYGSNYNETYVGANLVIGQRAITITADAQSKTYGNADPALTAQVTAGTIVNGDLSTGALTRATGENVGAYAISKASYTYGSNYNETYAGANLVIGQRAITITASAKSKYCGQTDPALTYSITAGSLVSTDTFSGALSRSAGESAGTYGINQGSLSLSTNYSLTYAGANLTIMGIAIDANASSTPQAIGSPITLKATVTPAADGITVSFYLDNVFKGTGVTNTSGLATLSIGTLATNVYEVKAIAGSGCSESLVFLPVYDPNGGFVTGGGWINSPVGAYVANTSLIGKANFGFVAKYKKGSTVPDGNTEFQFHAGNLNFNSSAYDDMRLVIAGSRANYKGTGTINGSGSYGFMVSAIDGQVSGGNGVDKFRIKIWNKINGAVVYDNNMGADENDLPTTILGGGSIVIHEVKGGKQSSTTPLADNTHNGLDMKIVEPVLEQKIKLGAYPNPFGKLATIAFTLPTDEQVVTLDVYDLKGSRIKRMYEGKAAAQQTLEFEFNGSNLSPGMYLLRLTTPNKVENFKMIMTE